VLQTADRKEGYCVELTLEAVSAQFLSYDKWVIEILACYSNDQSIHINARRQANKLYSVSTVGGTNGARQSRSSGRPQDDCNLIGHLWTLA